MTTYTVSLDKKTAVVAYKRLQNACRANPQITGLLGQISRDKNVITVPNHSTEKLLEKIIRGMDFRESRRRVRYEVAVLA